VLVIGPQQMADLRNQALVVSSDFSGARPYERGTVMQFMGIKIIESNRLPIIIDSLGNANSRACLLFVKSGLNLSLWQDILTRVDQRIDLDSLPYQISVMASLGATRTELGKVVQICCFDTSPAADNTP
jgi:hypothetical protein